MSGRGLCDELITRPEEFYRLCGVVVFDLEISRMGAPYIYDISRLRVKFGWHFNYKLWLTIYAFKKQNKKKRNSVVLVSIYISITAV